MIIYYSTKPKGRVEKLEKHSSRLTPLARTIFMRQVRAFAPGNISCFFKIYNHPNPRWMGSYGLGFTVNEGVSIEASKAQKTEIIFNNKKITFPAVQYVIDDLTKEKIKISITSSLPLGFGYGLSGASALAAAYAINALLGLKKTDKQLAILAHTADVVNRTGLGGVTNQYFGGFFVKFKPSSYFIARKIPLVNIPVYCRYFKKLSTKSVLTTKSLHKKINTAADVALKKVEELLRSSEIVSFGELITISKTFAETSGLLTDKKTIALIREVEKKNGHASMNMLGNAVFSDISFDGAKKLYISDKGAHLL